MRVLQILSIAANMAAVLQLCRLTLYRWYPGFLAFLIFNAARSLLLFSPDETIYLLTMPVLWILNVIVVLEIHRSVLADLPGVYSMARWALRIAMILAALVSAIVFPWGSQASGLLFWSTTLDHSVRWSILALVLLLVLFYTRYPLVLRRNIVVHCVIYAIYFLNDTFSSAAGQVNHAAVIIGIGCYTAWAVALTRAGQEFRVAIHSKRKNAR